MLVSVNIGVLLSEKLLPTQGPGLVFTERSGRARRREGGKEARTHTHTHTHTHTQGKKRKPVTNVNTITQTQTRR